MLIEQAKKVVEKLTGLRRPAREELAALIRNRKPVIRRFGDDGETPNNPAFPLLHYRNAVVLNGTHDPAAVFEQILASNGWKDSWRDGIYDFLHFHTGTHEVLGIARGCAAVRFGGANGQLVNLKAGDVVVLPAGTGHCRLSASRNLLVVGAYPAHSRYDEPRPDQVDSEKARAAILRVKCPWTDPLYGREGPLLRLWNGA